MDLNNKQVTHNVFGTGHVLSVENGHITVLFDKASVQKKFSYPGAFSEHLHMCDDSAQEFVADALRSWMQSTDNTEDERRQHNAEEASRITAEKKLTRKSTARARASKASKVTKTVKPKKAKTAKTTTASNTAKKAILQKMAAQQ